VFCGLPRTIFMNILNLSWHKSLARAPRFQQAFDWRSLSYRKTQTAFNALVRSPYESQNKIITYALKMNNYDGLQITYLGMRLSNRNYIHNDINGKMNSGRASVSYIKHSILYYCLLFCVDLKRLPLYPECFYNMVLRGR
jgi:hypothetical protein